jgi:hypothetical protein
MPYKKKRSFKKRMKSFSSKKTNRKTNRRTKRLKAGTAFVDRNRELKPTIASLGRPLTDTEERNLFRQEEQRRRAEEERRRAEEERRRAEEERFNNGDNPLGDLLAWGRQGETNNFTASQ